MDKIRLFLKLIVEDKELFKRIQDGSHQLKDCDTEEMIDGNIGLHFLNEILKKHEDAIPGISKGLVDLLTFLIDERNGLDILESWTKLSN